MAEGVSDAALLQYIRTLSDTFQSLDVASLIVQVDWSLQYDRPSNFFSDSIQGQLGFRIVSPGVPSSIVLSYRRYRLEVLDYYIKDDQRYNKA